MTPMSARSRKAHYMRRINAFEKFRRFLRGHHRGHALDEGVPWPAHGVRRVRCNDLARYPPVKQHPDTGQMLLNGGRFAGGDQSCETLLTLPTKRQVLTKILRIAPLVRREYVEVQSLRD